MLQRRPGRWRRWLRRVALGAVLLIVPLATGACSGWGRRCPPAESAAQAETRRDHAAHLEREVARLQADLHQAEEALVTIESRLRADLHQAEEAMVTIESGLLDVHTRADAVSSLAEARIAVERASQNVPWRPDAVREAQAKLEEAERQLQAGHPGSAVFFASRARRIADTLDAEARRVAQRASTRFVRSRRVNLRAGPSTDHAVVDVLTESTPVFLERQEGNWVLVRTVSGPAGWVYRSLLTPR